MYNKNIYIYMYICIWKAYNFFTVCYNNSNSRNLSKEIEVGKLFSYKKVQWIKYYKFQTKPYVSSSKRLKLIKILL